MQHHLRNVLIVFLCFHSLSSGEEDRDTKQHPELPQLVQNWASKLGGELWHFGDLVTRRSKVIESYKVTVVGKENGETILHDIHDKISRMMQQKVEAVKRIMDIAEQAAKAQKEEDVDFNFQYYNAKNLTNSLKVENASEPKTETETPKTQELRAFLPPEEETYQQDSESDESDKADFIEDSEAESPETGTEKDPLAIQTQPRDKKKLPLIRNRHFYNIPVNTNYSAVHVPSNVYDRSKDVISGIIWSEELDKTFRNNYKLDPTLSWQYFGSSTGFMRQFPAMSWSQEPVDLFDCRTRSWFIEAASSPKDIVILVDRSGSMTGMRREIARHVVHNILDTLGNNDFVNIFTFSNTTDPLVDCFGTDRLVQANLANVRVLKESMSVFKTEQIANFSLALITAFDLLEKYRDSKLKKGAGCNQAIMLITDGVQYNYKEIFEKYNWGNLPFMNVRVFTYLIGREVSDVREVKWMACANQGYYVHLSTYAEVREEVLQYIPVMARPMVLNANQKPKPTWSPVYADVTDPKLTNWLWVNRERNRQRERFQAYRKNKAQLSSDEQDKKFVHQQKFQQDHYGDTQTYHMMTSVSLPVYDKKPRAERVANLLGVAGTDIPIEYIQRLMLPYRLGVNGYAFIVTNNGYILTHPDLRPVYQGILKPAYNRVDVTEIEIMDDDSDPRVFSDEIKQLRNKTVFQEEGNVTLKVKSHLDDMRRIMTGIRHYYYMGINGTPFSLVVALPHKYGFNRVQHPVENDIGRMKVNKSSKSSITEFFTGNWTIHPDWQYCRYFDDSHYFDNPEEEFLFFLKKIENPGWKWLPECERKLMCQIVGDAKITEWFSQNITNTSNEEDGAELIKKFGVTVAFLATHSGLTRWQEFPQNIANSSDQQFHILHNRAIDEIWYKRAVEQHYVNQRNFLYSVPIDIGYRNDTLVTVSHAIFKDDKTNSGKAPAAVVGYQFYHSALSSLFRNITYSCGDKNCKKTCQSQELHCLLLDDNAYVIVSNNPNETGSFFGKIRGDIMFQLVEERIYQENRMYDYQGLCPEGQDTTSPASRLLTPFVMASKAWQWALGTLLHLSRSVGADYFETVHPEHEEEELDHEQREHEEHEMETGDQQSSGRNEKELDQRLLIQKTKPEPCDTEMYLYSLIHYSDRNKFNSGYNKSMSDCSRPFIVQPVDGSNMVLLVINNLCRIDEQKFARFPDPVQVNYNMSHSCYRALNNDFPRNRYMTCINRSANESEIKLCGGATNLTPVKVLTILITALGIRQYFL